VEEANLRPVLDQLYIALQPRRWGDVIDSSVAGDTPEQFAALMMADTSKWDAVIKRQNTQVE
jgi:hypothetical protein